MSSSLNVLSLVLTAMSVVPAYANPASMTSAAKGAVHTIQVGQDGLSYTPNSIKAAPGDKVAFEFASSGHTATQGDFNNPCQPLNALSFNSGFGDPGSDPFVVTINDTKPIYYYCAASGHCQAGMAAAINAPDGKSADDYIQASKTTSSSKGQSRVQGGTFTKTSSSPAATSSQPSAAARTGLDSVWAIGAALLIAVSGAAI